MYTETPIDAKGFSPDILSKDGKSLYRLYLHQKEIRIRTKEGGWAKFHREEKENPLRQLWLRMAYEGTLVHLKADGSTEPWQGRDSTLSPEPRTLNPDTSLVVAESAGSASVFGVEMDEAEVAAALSAQYRKANLATFEIVKFGAMVLSLEQALEGPKAGPGSVGLKGWLEKHCPEVCYRTIMRHKEVAKAIYRQYSQADSERTIEAFAQALQLDGSEDATAAELACSEAVKGLVFGKSARQLLFDFASRRSGRPVGSKSLEPYRPISTAEAEEMATIELEGIVNDLASVFTRHMHLKITDAQRRKACRLRLMDLADLIK